MGCVGWSRNGRLKTVRKFMWCVPDERAISRGRETGPPVHTYDHSRSKKTDVLNLSIL